MSQIQSKKTDHMTYLKDMEVLSDSTIMEQVLEAMEHYDYNIYTAEDVKRALEKPNKGPKELKALLSPAAEPFLEEMAQKAQSETLKHLETAFMFLRLFIFPIIVKIIVFIVVLTVIIKFAEQNWICLI